MKNTRTARMTALALALLLLLGATAAPAAATGASDGGQLIYPTSFGRTRVVPDANGVFVRLDKPLASQVGETEPLMAALMASPLAPSGETALVTVTGEGYDFSDCVPMLVIPADGTYYAKKLGDYTAIETTLKVLVRVGYLDVNSEYPVYLYFAPKKTEEYSTAKLTVTRQRVQQFDFGATIRIGDYTISKQGGGIIPVEIALGMANMDQDDLVYLVSDLEGEEVLRLVIHEGQLYGIARKVNGLVISLEYSFTEKAYVSALSGNVVLSKDTVLDVFRQLGVSFTNPPDEEDWLLRQKLYTSSKKIATGTPPQDADTAQPESPEPSAQPES